MPPPPHFQIKMFCRKICFLFCKLCASPKDIKNASNLLHTAHKKVSGEKGGYESLTEMVGCKSSSSSYYYSGFSTLLQYHILLTHPLSTVMSVLDKRARSHSISIQSGLPLARFVIIYMHFYMHYIYMHM